MKLVKASELLASRACCCTIINNLPASMGDSEAKGDIHPNASFEADARNLADVVRHLSPTGEEEDIGHLEELDVDHIRRELRERSRRAHGLNAIFFALVSGPGCLLGGELHVQCPAGGQWVSASSLAWEVSCEGNGQGNGVSLLIINTIDTGSITLKPCGPGGPLSHPGVELLWGISPPETNFFDAKGSVLGQLSTHVIDSQAEAVPVRDLFVRAASIFTWYAQTKLMEGVSAASCGARSGPGRGARISIGRAAQPAFYPTGNSLRDREGNIVGSKQWQTNSVHTLCVKVTIGCLTPGAEIFYTTDGSDPVPFEGDAFPAGSTTRRHRSKPIALAVDLESGAEFEEYVVRAVAICPGMLPSRVGESSTYTVQGKVKMVKFHEIRAEDSVMLTMTCATPGARIYYEESSEYPTVRSTLYVGPIRVHTRLVRAMAVAPRQTDSACSLFELLDQVAPPVCHAEGDVVPDDRVGLLGDGSKPQGTVYLDRITVHCTSQSLGRPGFKIRYTGDGSEPTTKSAVYQGPIVVAEAGTHRFAFIAFGDMMADSEVVEASFIVQNQVITPVITPGGHGIHKERVNVQVTCQTESAQIFWTLDGTEPVVGAHSTRKYSGPVVLDRCIPSAFDQPDGLLCAYSSKDGRPIQAMARAMARAPGMMDSEVTRGQFSILEVVQTPKLEPDGGLYCEYVQARPLRCDPPDPWMPCCTSHPTLAAPYSAVRWLGATLPGHIL